MNDKIVESHAEEEIQDKEIIKLISESLRAMASSFRKILLIPPDITRMHSGAGKITAMFYQLLKQDCQIHILPALGTHKPMSRAEQIEFFGPDIPEESYRIHHWRDAVIKLGEVPSDFVEEVSEGLFTGAIDVEVNRLLVDSSYDLIVSIGQVVPHEVVGMANYTKNILVGCGGVGMINQSHMLGAVYGMEKMMGRDHSPVRKVLDYAQQHFLNSLPLLYVLTVTSTLSQHTRIDGVYIGNQRSVFESAVRMSQQKNLVYLDRPIKKMVVWLNPKEFKSTWLGNKSIYRTRMAIADGGELLILAPGITRFGEDESIDCLIRKYGYIGSQGILSLYKTQEDLRMNLSAAAHLIHGSTEGRFSVTYAPGGLTREEVEQVNYGYMPLEEALKRYSPSQRTEGWNRMPDGEEIYYISNPALGLWADQAKFTEE